MIKGEIQMDFNRFESKIRKFNITVLSIPIVYDIFGDYDPNGLMYILSEDKDRVREKALCNFKNKDKNGVCSWTLYLPLHIEGAKQEVALLMCSSIWTMAARLQSSASHK